MMELEICVDSVESAAAAEAGGAQRVELCSGLIEGGLTPSLGLIRAVRARITIGLHVIIRPRGGDFLYSSEELAIMRDDILQAAQCGADGVVLGLLTADGNVDVARTRELIEAARPMKVTFHRAIDMARDLETALEDIVATGADLVLTSGGEQTALLGVPRLRKLVQSAKGRIRIMVGGGVRTENVEQLAQQIGAVDFHAALRSKQTSPMLYRVHSVHMGDARLDDYARSGVSPDDVRALRHAIDVATRPQPKLV